MDKDSSMTQGTPEGGTPTQRTGANKARRKNARQAPISTPPRASQQRGNITVSQRQMVQRRLRERAAAQQAEQQAEATGQTMPDLPVAEDPVTIDQQTAPSRTAAARRIPAIDPDPVTDATSDEPAPIVEPVADEAALGPSDDAAEPQVAGDAAEQPMAHHEDQQAGGGRGRKGHMGGKQRYVRKRTPHVTQPPVDDLAMDDASIGSYTHDSNVAVGGATPLSGMVYRRSRSNMPAFQRNLQYGQYLEIPKGRRAIFASRERAQRRRSVLSLLLVIILLAVAAIFIASLMRDAIANLG